MTSGCWLGKKWFVFLNDVISVTDVFSVTEKYFLEILKMLLTCEGRGG
jgi:hypothetical protein